MQHDSSGKAFLACHRVSSLFLGDAKESMPHAQIKLVKQGDPPAWHMGCSMHAGTRRLSAIAPSMARQQKGKIRTRKGVRTAKHVVVEGRVPRAVRHRLMQLYTPDPATWHGRLLTDHRHQT